MQRDIHRLTTEKFDVLIVGGGIYGATLARQCSMQGMKVALIDKNDFGSATSANSLKIIHGGLRYLQSMDFKRMRESIHARSKLLKIASNNVVPLPCLIATSKRFMRSRLVMGSALILNNLISWDRNRGLEANQRIPPGCILSQNVFNKITGTACEDVTGAASWHDALAVNTERLTLDFLISAVDNGACVANYLGMESYRVQKNRVTGVRATDYITNKECKIMADVTIDARGPWSESLNVNIVDKTAKLESTFPSWAMAFNVIVNKKIINDYAVGLSEETCKSLSEKNHEQSEKEKSREFFFVPWRGKTIIGTAYYACANSRHNCKLKEEELQKFIQQINSIFPDVNLGTDDICYIQSGLLPAKSLKINSEPELLNRPIVTDHEKKGGPSGLYTVTGVKYTTALPVADFLVRTITKKLGMKYRNIKNDIPLIETATDIKNENREGILDESFSFLEKRYGNKSHIILDMIKDKQSLSEAVQEDPPVIAAEIIYSIRNEMAYKLRDIIFRRTGIGSAGHPGKEMLKKVASLSAQELEWSKDKTTSELNKVEYIYSEMLFQDNSGK